LLVASLPLSLFHASLHRAGELARQLPFLLLQLRFEFAHPLRQIHR
jgi:hypothetical protein